MIISTGELKDKKESVTSVIFRKDEYTIEGIIRWLIDRKYNSDSFVETEKYYVFKQPNHFRYTAFEYKVIEGQNVGVELGVSKAGSEPVSRSIDELINL